MGTIQVVGLMLKYYIATSQISGLRDSTMDWELVLHVADLV